MVEENVGNWESTIAYGPASVGSSDKIVAESVPCRRALGIHTHHAKGVLRLLMFLASKSGGAQRVPSFGV